MPREAGAVSSQGAAPNGGAPAIDGQTTGPEKAAPYAGIGLVRMIVTIQYRVKDLYRFDAREFGIFIPEAHSLLERLLRR